MNAVTKLIVHKTALGKFFVMVLKNSSNEIRSNEIRIRRELPVFSTNSIWKLHNLSDIMKENIPRIFDAKFSSEKVLQGWLQLA